MTVINLPGWVALASALLAAGLYGWSLRITWLTGRRALAVSFAFLGIVMAYAAAAYVLVILGRLDTVKVGREVFRPAQPAFLLVPALVTARIVWLWLVRPPTPATEEQMHAQAKVLEEVAEHIAEHPVVPPPDNPVAPTPDGGVDL